MIMKRILLLLLIFIGINAFSQLDRWQQRVKYNINVSLDVVTNLLNGTETIDYWNNSPDTLRKVFFHLYWNAFQPGSSMDIRSQELGKIVIRQTKEGRNVLDWDRRVKDTLSKLKPDQIGYQKVKSIKQNGKVVQTRLHETILEVTLDKPIAPKTRSSFAIEFEAQVPVQIRRTGRDNADSVRYTIAQWYPRMAEYDEKGWQINPYIAREFYGVWGDYDVTIKLDITYMVAATGVLQNPANIGYGYPDSTGVVKGKNIWHFKANNVHDFVWTADPGYTRISHQFRKDLTLNVYFKNKNATADSAWHNILWATEKVLPFIEKQFGKYPWPQFSFIQGGDNGTEYPMATLMSRPSLTTAFHELMHAWYYQALANNETLYAWMDEGFATWAEDIVSDHYLKNWANQSPYISEAKKAENTKKITGVLMALPAIHDSSYSKYFALQKSPFEEAMSIPGDHYNTNYGYNASSYYKGAVFVEQLGYIISAKLRDSLMLEYYRQWKFRHPNPDDFIRLAEKIGGLELGWYKDYWINTIKPVDYSIGNITYENGKTQILLNRIGKMPMPIDVLLTFKDGTKEVHYIPLDMMYGEKPAEDSTSRFIHEPWKWTHPQYVFETMRNLKDLRSVEIDPSKRMADINQANNSLRIPD
jgi:hypothetical protein